jgi:hypothetical protein
MEKVKKAQAGAGLKRKQYKRLGRISAKNPERAEKVLGRMKERVTRVQRGKEFAGDDPGAKVRKAMEEAREFSKSASKAKNGKSFPDLNKDGKITKADILKGRGVIKNGGKIKKAQAGKSIDSTGIYKKRAEDAGNKLLKDDVRNFGKNIKDFATKQADLKRYGRKGKPGYDEQGNRKPLSLKFKLRKGQAGLTASTKRVGPIDPKGAWTKVQEMNLPPRNVKTSVSLKKDKQLGATKMKSGGKMKKKK